MSITLNATLQTAQDGKTHNPIIEIISQGLVAEIPFDGQFLTNETTNEQKPNIILHSSGRLSFVYTYGTTYIEFVTTDADKTEFTHTRILNTSFGCGALEIIIEASICELSDNTIGIVLATSDTTNYYLRRAIITIAGSVSNIGLIGTYAKSSYNDLKSPFVTVISDGSYYLVYILDDSSDLSYIKKRTSSDFITWSASATVNISGLSTNTKDNISLFLLSNDDIFLMVDYNDDINYSNCYYSISSDDGSTWGAAVALTSYDDATASGKHPVMWQVDSDTVYIAYYEESTSLVMDEDTDGMPETMPAAGLSIADITVDPDTSRAYLTITWMYSGYKKLYAVIEIDLKTWEVLDYWDDDTTPAFSDTFFGDRNVWYLSNSGYKDQIPVAVENTLYYRHIAVLDASEDEITHYNFDDHAAELQRNLLWIAWGVFGSLTNFHIDLTYIDSSSRLWVVQSKGHSLGGSVDICYINLSEGTFVYEGDNYYNHYQIARDNISEAMANSYKAIQIDMTNDHVYLSMTGTAGYAGQLKIYDMNEGTVYRDKTYFPQKNDWYNVELSTGHVIGNFVGGTAGIPRNGFKRFLLDTNKIWGIFDYESGYGESGNRGLCEVITENVGEDITIREVNYYRPSWGSYNDYLFHDLKYTSDNKIIISGYYGITVFDPVTKEWTLFNNANYPGLTPNGENNFYSLGYDSSTDMVISGRAGVSNINDLIGFSLGGPLKKTYYKEGTYSGGWSFGSAAELIEEYNDYEAVPIYDTSDLSLYLFWTKKILSELSIKWDRDLGQLDLTPYLLRDVEVVLSWTADNLPGELSFGLSCGHLFDPHNVNSLISKFLTKERSITVRLGETISDVNYWQEQGTFMIKTIVLSDYERGRYPTVSVTCKDLLDLLEETHVIATDYYETGAEAVITDILEDDAEVNSEDIDSFTFTNSTTIYSQWLDCDVLTILSEICDRFGYFMIIDMDGVFTCRKITNAASVSHTYSNTDDIIKWSPQDKYSDRTNQVIVVGEERDYNEIVYSEERIITRNGTTGWWAGGERIALYYSEDKSRICYHPKLEWINKPMGLGVWRDNLDAHLEEMDDYKGVYLVIDAPNQVAYLLLLIGLISSYWALSNPDGVSISSKQTIPYGRVAEGLHLILIMDVLSAMTNWQASINAKPVGYVRRTIQAIADDTPHQIKINKTIKVKIEEPLCYEVSHCQDVADHELMLKQLNRKRAAFTKIMHLQDEIGDTLSILHPFSKQALRIFILNLTRRYKMADTNKKNGYCFDDIEGWVL